jgi:hypothetical protein
MLVKTRCEFKIVANLKTKSVKTPNNNHKIQEQRNHSDVQSSKIFQFLWKCLEADHSGYAGSEQCMFMQMPTNLTTLDADFPHTALQLPPHSRL